MIRRIGIFVFYQPDGEIQPYEKTLLEAMAPYFEKFIVVTNGALAEDTKQYFLSMTEHVVKRENKGYDAGAYQDILLNYLADEQWGKWDELILFNNTFYGPVHSLDAFFAFMEGKDCDYWGMTRRKAKGKMPEHISSFFVAYRKQLLEQDLFWDFWKQLDDITGYYDCVKKFEQGWGRYSAEHEIKGIAYTDFFDEIECKPGDIEYLCCAYDLISKTGFPIVKRNLFAPTSYEEEQKVLEYIEKNLSYDVGLIKEDVAKLEAAGRVYPFSETNVLSFCKNHDKVYIYGRGQYGMGLAYFLNAKGVPFEGHVLSQGAEKFEDAINVDELHLSPKDGVIMALGEAAVREVYPMVKDKIAEGQMLRLLGK